MLNIFEAIRSSLEITEKYDGNCVKGKLSVSQANIDGLIMLQNEGHIDSAKYNQINISFELSSIQLPYTVTISLKALSLRFYEDIEDLIAKTIRLGEPEEYCVFRIGFIKKGDQAIAIINHYRAMLRLKMLLEKVADLFNSVALTAILLTPARLEISLDSLSEDKLCPLPDLHKLEAELVELPIERDQRLALFKRSVGDYLRSVPAKERFGFLLQNLHSIYQTYHKDFLLWIGESFSSTEKAFEEKRLKLVSDLNSLLSGIQGSIIAIPLAAIIVGDKFDSDNLPKMIFLISGIVVLVLICWQLLDNQSKTLTELEGAIEAIRNDYPTKFPDRKAEFGSRLKGVSDQAVRIKLLIGRFKCGLIVLSVVMLSVFFLSFEYPSISKSKNSGNSAVLSPVISPAQLPAPSPGGISPPPSPLPSPRVTQTPLPSPSAKAPANHHFL